MKVKIPKDNLIFVTLLIIISLILIFALLSPINSLAASAWAIFLCFGVIYMLISLIKSPTEIEFLQNSIIVKKFFSRFSIDTSSVDKYFLEWEKPLWAADRRLSGVQIYLKSGAVIKLFLGLCPDKTEAYTLILDKFSDLEKTNHT